MGARARGGAGGGAEPRRLQRPRKGGGGGAGEQRPPRKHGEGNPDSIARIVVAARPPTRGAFPARTDPVNTRAGVRMCQAAVDSGAGRRRPGSAVPHPHPVANRPAAPRCDVRGRPGLRDGRPETDLVVSWPFGRDPHLSPPPSEMSKSARDVSTPSLEGRPSTRTRVCSHALTLQEVAGPIGRDKSHKSGLLQVELQRNVRRNDSPGEPRSPGQPPAHGRGSRHNTWVRLVVKGRHSAHGQWPSSFFLFLG